MLNRTLINSILVFIAGSSYGFIVPIVKTANEAGISPDMFLPLQYLVGFVVCWVVVAVRGVKLRGGKQLASLLVLGVFTGATSIFYYQAVTRLPASAALTLLFQYLWMSVIIECVHKKVLPSKSTVAAVVVVLVGAAFATGLVDGNVKSLDSLGVLYGLASAFFYALYLYFSGSVAVEQPTEVRTLMLTLGGLLGTSLVCPSAYWVSLPDPATWPYTLILAFLGIILPTSLINYASPKLSAGMVSVMASSELPLGVLTAWVFVNDVPSGLVLFGCALVFAGILVKQAPLLVARHVNTSYGQRK